MNMVAMGALAAAVITLGSSVLVGGFLKIPLRDMLKAVCGAIVLGGAWYTIAVAVLATGPDRW